jgi:hypothetical protein
MSYGISKLHPDLEITIKEKLKTTLTRPAHCSAHDMTWPVTTSRPKAKQERGGRRQKFAAGGISGEEDGTNAFLTLIRIG